MKPSRLSIQMLRGRGRLLLQVATLLLALGYFVSVVVRVRRAPAPMPVPAASGDVRFGVALEQRKAIYARILSLAPRWRRSASMVRHRQYRRHVVFMAQLASHVRAAARRHALTETQLWLVVDEGIRNHWTSGRYPPLPATVVPLSLTTR